MRNSSPTAETHYGALWRPGLPPGVYEERPAVARARDVRMDVTAFLGLAERGPLATPVAISSYAEYLKFFGAPGQGRLLGDSVRLAADKTAIRWLKAPDANVYNVYRGSRAAAAPFAYNHTCYATEVTDIQVNELHHRIDQAPAGGNALLVIVLVILFTELMGYTDFIPAIRPAN